MAVRLRASLFAAIVALLVLGVVATRGTPTPRPNPPGTFALAAMGDAPYYPWEEIQYRLVLRSLDEHDLRFVLHVGDLFWHPCSDEMYQRSLERLDALRHPVVYTPGDNEWTDCWESGSGAFAPRERLARLRQLFFAEPTKSLGRNKIALETQGGSGPYADFVENARFTYEGIVVATVHLVGSRNGRDLFPGRTQQDDDYVKLRTEAATTWMRETFAEAEANQAGAVVIAFQANPAFESEASDPYRRSFEPFLSSLAEEVARFARPVLVVQGDAHRYLVDHPLAGLPNFTRLQVPGSPRVGWVRVVVTPGPEPSFAFEQHVVPAWKYW
jgi:hypothetical protein